MIAAVGSVVASSLNVAAFVRQATEDVRTGSGVARFTRRPALCRRVRQLYDSGFFDEARDLGRTHPAMPPLPTAPSDLRALATV